VLVHDVPVPVPLLISAAVTPSKVWALDGLDSKPLPSPPPSAAFAVGLKKLESAGGTAHMLGTPPPPQISGLLQVPQTNVPPHPSGILPQFLPWAAHVVGTQLAGVTVSVSPADRAPSVAVITTVVLAATGRVVTVSTATLLPGTIVTLGGSDATASLLEVRLTVGPPALDRLLSQMVALELFPPVTACGLISKKPSTGTGAAGAF